MATTATIPAGLGCPPGRVGCVQARMDLMGAWPVVCYEVDAAEDARRRAAGGGAVPEQWAADVLDLLLGLPVGMPVPVGSLTDRERWSLDRCPPWAASVSLGEVTRWAVPPATVHLVVVEAGRWRSGLVSAGLFAAFSSRAVLLSRRPRPAAMVGVLVDAAVYEVGVACPDEDGGVEVLVPPYPWMRMRWTAAGWRFRERAYQQHFQGGTP